MSAWLHNMSVPPRSTLTVERQRVPGRRFRVSFAALWHQAEGAGDTPLAWALDAGVAGALALLESRGERPIYDRAATLHRARALATVTQAGAVARAVETRIAEAGIPAWLGVFIDHDAEEPADARLDAGTSLAVLARRSGPLYIPTRAPQLSLVVPCQHATLVFPLEDADDDR